METKLKFVFSFLAITLFCSAWTGTRMRKSSGVISSGPLAFSAGTIASIRPGQKWLLTATGGAAPYTFDITAGSGSVSSGGIYTASSSSTGSTTVRVTDALSTQVTTSIANTTATATMTDGSIQMFADPQMTLLDSGGVGGNYSPNETSYLLIRGDVLNTSVNLTFDSFGTEGGYDILTVKDGTNSGAVLGSLSGASIPGPLTAAAGSMYFNFSSDSGVQSTGYQALWSIIPASLSMVHLSRYAIDVGTNETFIATGGVGPYTFSVISGVGSILPSGSDSAAGVFNSVAVGSTTIRVTDSQGTTYDETIAVANSNLCSDVSSNQSTGVLYDQGGPSGNYLDASTCGFVITPSSPGSGIQLNFDYVMIENTYDTIDIYDGTDATGTHLATYSGFFPSTPTVTATSGSMYVVLTSDVAKNYPGFRAYWKVLP